MSAVFVVQCLQSGINKQSAQTYMESISHNRNDRTNVDDEPTTREKKNCYTLILAAIVFEFVFVHMSSKFVCFFLNPFRQIYFNVIRKLRVNYYETSCFCEEEEKIASNSLLCVKNNENC